MSIMLSGRGRPLGTGLTYPAGSVRDSELTSLLTSYKRNIAGYMQCISQAHRL